MAARATKRKASKAKPKAGSRKTSPKKKPATQRAEPAPAKSTKETPSRKSAKKKVTVEKRRKAAPAHAKKKPARTKLDPVAARTRRREREARKRKLANYRKLLLDRQQSLLQTYLSSKGATRVPARDGTEDYIDYAVSSYDRDFKLSLTELDRRQLQLVDEALKRLDHGDYGACCQCGQEIPERRLEVESWARYCIRCQELDDQGILQQHDFGPDDDEEDEEAGEVADDAESGDESSENDLDKGDILADSDEEPEPDQDEEDDI